MIYDHIIGNRAETIRIKVTLTWYGFYETAVLTVTLHFVPDLLPPLRLYIHKVSNVRNIQKEAT